MQDRTPWLKLLGGLWLLLGALGAIWSGSTLLPVPLPGLLSLPVRSLALALRLTPWSQIAVGAGAIFFLVAGWGLLRRYSWVQTLMVPAHLLAGAYAGVAAIAVYLLRDRFQAGWAGSVASLCALLAINAALALFMNSVRSSEALSWLPLRTSPAIPSTCEFCGSPLDPETQQCPQCRSIPPIVHRYVTVVPPPAKLISLSDETEHWIEPDRRTRIGRGLSGNDINLSNPTVSRQHAQVEYVEGHYVLAALQDSNGTFVNDTLIRHRALQDGDEVRFGKARFRFTIVEPERPDAP